jgi:hypothetical protein
MKRETKRALTPDVSSTAEVDFEDGRFVVPKWWLGLPSLRTGDSANGIRRVPYTIEEARIKVNNDLLNGAIRVGMRKAVYGAKER